MEKNCIHLIATKGIHYHQIKFFKVKKKKLNKIYKPKINGDHQDLVDLAVKIKLENLILKKVSIICKK
jgi:hypothetical protein